jgi:Rrf2 family transcriptional regulator, nitric oxide-sensitive transcriptional repressor
MISQTAQYALRAVICLAMRGDSPLTTDTLSEMTKVSPEYLSKVMQALVRGNIVVSKPGKTGGFSLKVSPEDLTIQSVVDLIDSPSFGEEFSLDMQSYGNPLRPLYQKLRSINALLRNECAAVRILDLLPQGGGCQELAPPKKSH